MTAKIFERNGNAVAALLIGIAGLAGFGIVLGPTAIVLGLMARSQIASDGRPGIRVATLGMVIGVVALAIPIVYAVT